MTRALLLIITTITPLLVTPQLNEFDDSFLDTGDTLQFVVSEESGADDPTYIGTGNVCVPGCWEEPDRNQLCKGLAVAGRCSEGDIRKDCQTSCDICNDGTECTEDGDNPTAECSVMSCEENPESAYSHCQTTCSYCRGYNLLPPWFHCQRWNRWKKIQHTLGWESGKNCGLTCTSVNYVNVGTCRGYCAPLGHLQRRCWAHYQGPKISVVFDCGNNISVTIEVKVIDHCDCRVLWHTGILQAVPAAPIP